MQILHGAKYLPLQSFVVKMPLPLKQQSTNPLIGK